MNKLKLMKYREIISNIDDFNKKVVEPVKEAAGNLQWLNDSKKFYSMKLLHFIIYNKFSNRYIRYTDDEFLPYFHNIFIQYTPTFYVKVSKIVEDVFSELQINKNTGKRTTIESTSKNSKSTMPYNNTVNIGDTADSNGSNKYTQTAFNENILSNMEAVVSSKMSSDISLYLNCFSELFTEINFDYKDEFKGKTVIVGAKGDKGPMGDKGDTGPKGDKGDTRKWFDITKTWKTRKYGKDDVGKNYRMRYMDVYKKYVWVSGTVFIDNDNLIYFDFGTRTLDFPGSTLSKTGINIAKIGTSHLLYDIEITGGKPNNPIGLNINDITNFEVYE